MAYTDMIKNLSEKFDKPQTEIRRLLKESNRIFGEILDQDVKISIPHLGTFKSVLKKRRKSFNPQIQKFMLLPKKRIIKFSPGTSLKAELENKRISS